MPCKNGYCEEETDNSLVARDDRGRAKEDVSRYGCSYGRTFPSRSRGISEDFLDKIGHADCWKQPTGPNYQMEV